MSCFHLQMRKLWARHRFIDCHYLYASFSFLRRKKAGPPHQGSHDVNHDESAAEICGGRIVAVAHC